MTAELRNEAEQIPSVQMRNLSKWYGAFQVLKDINIDVRKGEKLVICGPSGSGKSTLVRCVNQLESYQQGSLWVQGVDMSAPAKQTVAVQRSVGMVFQQFNLFPHLTILENCVLSPIWVKKMPRKAAEELAHHYLTKVRIPEQADKYPGQLSGGQSQRVAIARALCMEPAIMLLRTHLCT